MTISRSSSSSTLLILGILATPSISWVFSNRSSPIVSNIPLPFSFKSPRIPCIAEGAQRQAPVRSLLDCVVKCFVDWRFDCLRVNFWKENSSCLFFEKRESFVDNFEEGCFSFRNFGCPHSYSFLQMKESCFKMEIGNFSWVDSKALCNQQHPEGHPFTLETVAKYRAVHYFASLINASDPKVSCCITPHPLHEVMKLWTGGSIFRDPVTGVYSYWWEPFGVKEPFGEGNLLWGPTKPDHYLNQEFCIGTMTDLYMNDDKCATKMCALCEINLIALND